jgi:HEAT repeat protein
MWQTNLSGSRLAWQSGPIRTALLGLLLLAVSLAAPNRGQGDTALPDVVEDFRRALKVEAGDALLRADSKSTQKRVLFALEYRGKNLRAIAKRMTSLGDLSRALILQEWLPVDSTVREELLQRFKKELQAALGSSDPLVLIAAAAVVSEGSSNARKQEPQQSDVRFILSSLRPELIKLTTHANAAVVAAGALALGQIQGEAKELVPVLKKLLAASNPLEVRQAAAQALADQIQFLITQVTTPGGPRGFGLSPLGAPKPEARIQELKTEARDYGVQALEAFIALPSAGLSDPDVGIRLQCTNIVGQIALGLRSQVPDGNPAMFPPQDKNRKASRADALFIKEQRDMALEDFKFYRPLFESFRKAAPNLAAVTLDNNIFIRHSAENALDDVAGARRRMRNLLDSLPPVPVPEEEKEDMDKEKPAMSWRREPALPYHQALATSPPMVQLVVQKDDKELLPEPFPRRDDPLLAEPGATLDALIKDMLTSLDVRSRTLAVDAIETMGGQGEPAIPYLIKALGDCSLYVRWASARTLGRLAPDLAEAVVPEITKLLCDPDVDVRTAAATALERFGLLARSAIPELTRAAGPDEDVEQRIAAMKALVATGTDGASAVPQIALGLTDTNVRIRRQAAQTLARFGPLARSAASALQQALTDTDPDVRKDAADALIKVLGK